MTRVVCAVGHAVICCIIVNWMVLHTGLKYSITVVHQYFILYHANAVMKLTDVSSPNDPVPVRTCNQSIVMLFCMKNLFVFWQRKPWLGSDGFSRLIALRIMVRLGKL